MFILTGRNIAFFYKEKKTLYQFISPTGFFFYSHAFSRFDNTYMIIFLPIPVSLFLPKSKCTMNGRMS